MGSGIWTWNKYWYDHRITERAAGACVEACYEKKVKEIFFTMWGDNGAYCDHDSAFAGMVFCADKSYGASNPDAASLEKRFATVCGGSYAAHVLAGDLVGGIGGSNDANIMAVELVDCAHGMQPDMWDDPLFETRFRTWAADDTRLMAKVAQAFTAQARKLSRHRHSRATGNLHYAYCTAKAFADRYTLSAALLRAYRRRDRKGLQAARRRISKTVESVLAMEESFRTMWMSHNKPEGIETIQARFGMLTARYHELDRRLREYLRGDITSIPELDCHCPPRQ